jgi:hypothetical protein
MGKYEKYGRRQKMKTKARVKKRTRIIGFILGVVLLTAIGTVVIMKIIYPGMNFTTSAKVTTVESSVDKFKYDPAKVETGTVYHYTKSNIDGSKPGYDSIFVSSNEYLEVFKIYPKYNATFYVTADMDWSVFSAKALDGYEIYKDGSRKLVMHSELSKESNEYVFDGANRYSLPIGQYPVHNFNFDFISLNFSFRHLANPEGTFDIGVLYPAFDLTSFIKFVYPGKATVSFVSDESRNGSACRKYEISGAGIGNKTGFIWVNKEKAYIEDMEIQASDNPGWATFKLNLTGVETMSQDEWNAYIEKQSKDYFASLDK